MDILCGVGKASITPPLGTPLAGYTVQKRVATEVHDPLQVRVIAVKHGTDYFIIVSLDLLFVDKMYTDQLTRRVEERFHIPPENVFVHATHTHSGPGGNLHDSSLVQKAFPNLNGHMTYSPSLVTKQHDQIMSAIENALSSLELCDMRYGEHEVYGIATNRNSPHLPYDSKLRVVEFRFRSGDAAILYHFACHPTVMHADNLAISADFPGAASRKLEQRSHIRLALYLNGPCADISTRFTRRESSFAEVERLGGLLSEGVFHILSHTVPLENASHCHAWRQTMTLTTRDIPDPSILQTQLKELRRQYRLMKDRGQATADLRKLETKVEGITSSLEIGDRLQGISHVDTSLQIIKIGEIFFVGIPGELFHETGKEMTAPFKNASVLVAGNTNDQLGYIVPEPYYEQSSYESFMALLARGASEMFRDTVRSSIRQIDSSSERH